MLVFIRTTVVSSDKDFYAKSIALFQELDCLLSEHVMAIHSKTGGKLGQAQIGPRVRPEELLNASDVIDNDKPLRYVY